MPHDEGQVLYLWELVTSGAPSGDRLGWLAARTDIPFRELDWARRMRNRIAHPDGAWLDPADVTRAAEILTDALDQLEPSVQAVDSPRDHVDLPGPWSRGPRPVRQFRAAIYRLLSRADPVFARLGGVRRPLQIVVPVLLGLAVLWIAVDTVGGFRALGQPLTYLWLVLVLALIALAILFLPEILGVLLIATLVYGLVTGNWLALLQTCIGIAVVGAVGGLLSWLYDLD